MKTATYQGTAGPIVVEYDENAPCFCCGEPVIEASMGGTNLCPWCDCGNCRYCGQRFNYNLSECLRAESPKEYAHEWVRRHVAQCKLAHIVGGLQ